LGVQGKIFSLPHKGFQAKGGKGKGQKKEGNKKTSMYHRKTKGTYTREKDRGPVPHRTVEELPRKGKKKRAREEA